MAPGCRLFHTLRFIQRNNGTITALIINDTTKQAWKSGLINANVSGVVHVSAIFN